MERTTTLAYRKAGTHDWVEIDPTTTRGQRLLASFRITTHSMEEEMNATTAAATAAAAGSGGEKARLYVVPGDNVENMGALLRMRRAARHLTDRLRNSARGAWGWIVRTFHLDAAIDYVKGAGSWLYDKAAAAARFLGTGGLAGAGLLAISTEVGRKVIATALKPVGWVLGLLGRAWVTVENALFSEKREGGIRNTISTTMADIRTFFFGDGTAAGRHGVIPTAAVWAITKVGRFFMLGSYAMRTARAAGIAALAPKMLSLLNLLPLGVFLVPARMLTIAFVAYTAYDPFSEDITRGFKKVTGSLKSDVAQADTTVAKTEDRVSEEVHAAAATTTTVPVNRAERREAVKKAGARR